MAKGSPEFERTFEAFYTTHFDRVAGAVLPLADSREEAFDIAQDAFLRTWATWDEFADGDVEPVRYTLRIALNMGLSRLRRLRRLRHRLPRLLGPTEAPSPEEAVGVRLDLIRALRKIPAKQRAAVVLCDGLGLSSGEAAATLEVSDATVRVHLSRGRARLRTLYTADEADEA